MDNVIFDVSKKDGINYKHDKIIVVKGNENYNNYVYFLQVYSGKVISENIKFKIQCLNGNTITVDTRGLMSGNHKVTRLEFYYRSETTIDPIIFAVFLQPEGGTSGKLGNRPFIYKFREITSQENGSTVELTSLKQIEKINQENLDREYKALDTTIKIELNYGNGVHNVEIKENKGDICECPVNVNVEGPEKLIDSYFVKYTYTFEGGGFSKLEIKQTQYRYLLTGLESSDFNDVNLKNVTVYYHNEDSQRVLPLLIQFTPKSGKKFGNKEKHSSICYEIKSINKKDKEDDPNKLDCLYTSCSCLFITTDKLQSLYQKEHIKMNIEKIIGSKKSPAVAGTIISVFAFIAIPVGVLIYFHTPKIRTMLARLPRRF